LSRPKDPEHVLALERRIDSDLTLGRAQGLVAELAALVASHPYHEPSYRQLMLALYRSGRQTEALGAFRRAGVLAGQHAAAGARTGIVSLHNRPRSTATGNAATVRLEPVQKKASPHARAARVQPRIVLGRRAAGQNLRGGCDPDPIQAWRDQYRHENVG
jgi:DNA-binding SARP family transcriptional activator